MEQNRWGEDRFLTGFEIGGLVLAGLTWLVALAFFLTPPRAALESANPGELTSELNLLVVVLFAALIALAISLLGIELRRQRTVAKEAARGQTPSSLLRFATWAMVVPCLILGRQLPHRFLVHASLSQFTSRRVLVENFMSWAGGITLGVGLFVAAWVICKLPEFWLKGRKRKRIRRLFPEA